MKRVVANVVLLLQEITDPIVLSSIIETYFLKKYFPHI